MLTQGDPSALIKALRYGHGYTARIDFTSLDQAAASPGPPEKPASPV